MNDGAIKYAVILPDGAADEPVSRLGGRTPLEAAAKPNIDWVSIHGRQGTVVTVPDRYLPGSDVATLSLFGYDPHACYDGRAPLEAVAQGIRTGASEVIFRCNLVAIIDGAMEDFTAGHISQAEAAKIIADLNERFADRGCRFYPGVSYRNLMVLKDLPEGTLECTPPHDIPGQQVEQHMPRGSGAERIVTLMTEARALLARHDVNAVRRDLGETPATDIWLWGQGRPRPLSTFHDRFGLRGACIAAVDIIRGIAMAAGFELIEVPGATGYLDTDYAAKGRAAAKALDDHDIVVVHVEAPDEAGHLGDVDAKVTAIERVDQHVVGPVLEKLRTFDRWRVLIAPDHPTPVEKKVHTRTPPPFCMAGERINPVLERPFSETNAQDSDLHVDPGHELMEYFLRL